MRRKGELSSAGIDTGWPYQVALPERRCTGGGYKEIHEFCAGLSLCPRGHAVHHDGQWFQVYCFSDPGDAQKFKERFAGETINPSERGRGADWARWRKQ
jgi:hypothetical protein